MCGLSASSTRVKERRPPVGAAVAVRNTAAIPRPVPNGAFAERCRQAREKRDHAEAAARSRGDDCSRVVIRSLIAPLRTRHEGLRRQTFFPSESNAVTWLRAYLVCALLLVGCRPSTTPEEESRSLESENAAGAVAPEHPGGEAGVLKSPAISALAVPVETMTEDAFAKRFNVLADEYERHCHASGLSSSRADYINHRSYRELAKLGKRAVPLVLARVRLQQAEEKDLLAKGQSWDKSDSVWASWEWVLDGMTGMGFAAGASYKVDEALQRYAEWWDQQRAKGGKKQ
jgi:hypothetical protein